MDITGDDFAELSFTFWGANYFVDASNNDTVPLGTQMNWKVYRIVDKEDFEEVSAIQEKT